MASRWVSAFPGYDERGDVRVVRNEAGFWAGDVGCSVWIAFVSDYFAAEKDQSSKLSDTARRIIEGWRLQSAFMFDKSSVDVPCDDESDVRTIMDAFVAVRARLVEHGDFAQAEFESWYVDPERTLEISAAHWPTDKPIPIGWILEVADAFILFLAGILPEPKDEGYMWYIGLGRGWSYIGPKAGEGTRPRGQDLIVWPRQGWLGREAGR